ncbi:MAG: DEAD/DEAH box helicase [Chloroflexi bacterium]|nr:DEAD/DEAH box helicase [Chloroflexota bacterium]
MQLHLENPLIVQSDKTILLEVENGLYQEARDALARFAELEKSPEHIHTYRLTSLSLWNAAAAGLTAERILDDLTRLSKYPVPNNVRVDIADAISRYGRVKLVLEDGRLLIVSDDEALMELLARHKLVAPFLRARLGATSFQIAPADRGRIKQVLMQVGYPAEDLAGYVEGAHLAIHLRDACRATGQLFQLRAYQVQASDTFYAGGGPTGGSGVIVLPCGAGKTMVGLAAMEKLQSATLILTTNTVAARQWMAELLDKTTLIEDQIGEYSGQRKEIRPITVATYQILTYHPRRKQSTGPLADLREEFPHFALFDQLDWGLIIYDEVHLLPAPVFRITAEIQARRRLGMTATLVREDGREGDVFSLVGPKKYDVPWKELETQGWIAPAECHEIRIPLPDDLRMAYAIAPEVEKYRVAAENPAKLEIVRQLIRKHADDTVLVIGVYLTQLHRIAEMLDAPLITGETSIREREKLFEQLRRGEIRRLIVSKVANFSIDLPDANVAIQVSGTFGSRQEEAQRLGRILRPKKRGLLAHFYALASRDTIDQDYAAHRQMFLTEQGYRYDILYANEIEDWMPAAVEGQVVQPAPPLLLPAGSLPGDGGA